MSACRFRFVPFLTGMAVAAFLVGPVPRAVAQDDGDDGPRVRITVDDRNSGFEVEVNEGSIKTADFVRFGESVHIKKGEHVIGDVVVIGNELRVDGRVTGDCVVIGGNLELGPGAIVDRGEVVCIGGNLVLGDSAQVETNVASVWGNSEISPTAVVGGEIGVWDGPWFDDIDIVWGGRHFSSGIGEFFGWLLWLVILLFLGLMAYFVFPSRMRRLADTVDHRGLVSFLAGVAGWVLWLPVFVLLCITLVGIPVAILLFFLTPLMVLVGFLGVAMTVGMKTRGGTGVGTVLIGLVVLHGAVLVGALLGAFPSIFEFVGDILCVIGASILFIATTMGFGAFLMTRFRPEERPAADAGTVPPAPPPGHAPLG